MQNLDLVFEFAKYYCFHQALKYSQSDQCPCMRFPQIEMGEAIALDYVLKSSKRKSQKKMRQGSVLSNASLIAITVFYHQANIFCDVIFFGFKFLEHLIDKVVCFVNSYLSFIIDSDNVIAIAKPNSLFGIR